MCLEQSPRFAESMRWTNCPEMRQSDLVRQVVRQLAGVGLCLVLVGCGSELQVSSIPIDSGRAPTASPAVLSSTASTVPVPPDSVFSTATTVETATSSGALFSGDDPQAVTGDKIGDPVDTTRTPALATDGTLNLADIPEWVSVSRDGFVVGYAKKTDLFSVPDSNLDSIGKPIPVYDNQGSKIGVLGTDGFVPNSP